MLQQLQVRKHQLRLNLRGRNSPPTFKTVAFLEVAEQKLLVWRQQVHESLEDYASSSLDLINDFDLKMLVLWNGLGFQLVRRTAAQPTIELHISMTLAGSLWTWVLNFRDEIILITLLMTIGYHVAHVRLTISIFRQYAACLKQFLYQRWGETFSTHFPLLNSDLCSNGKTAGSLDRCFLVSTSAEGECAWRSQNLFQG